MIKRLLFLTITASLCVAVSFVSPAAALSTFQPGGFTYSGSTPAFNSDGTLTDDAWNLLKSSVADGVEVGTTDASVGVIGEATTAGTLTASLVALSDIAVIGAGSYVVYKVSRPLFGDYIAEKVFGFAPDPPVVTGVDSWQWTHYPGLGGTWPTGNPDSSASSSFACLGDHTTCPGFATPDATDGTAPGDVWVLAAVYGGTGRQQNFCESPTDPWSGFSSSVIDAWLGQHGTMHLWQPNGFACHDAPGQGFKYLNDEQMYQEFGVQTVPVADLPSGGDPHRGPDVTLPSTTPSKTDAGAVIVPPDPADATPPQKQAQIDIQTALDPSWTPSSDIELLSPNPNETYDDYVARLVAAGLVGTITRVDESAPVDGYGPLSPTRISFTNPSTGLIRVLDPNFWPSTPVSLAPDTDITIRVNPDGVPPVPTEGGTPDPSIPTASIDWTPLENLTMGTHFPFGALTYVGSVLGWFNVSPVCPGFDIAVPGVTGTHDVAAPGSYAGNLCWANTYMGWVRTMESIALWIGAVWLVATRFLKWNWGGDLSEAADDGAVF